LRKENNQLIFFDYSRQKSTQIQSPDPITQQKSLENEQFDQKIRKSCILKRNSKAQSTTF
jgi:hypothetical protein